MLDAPEIAATANKSCSRELGMKRKSKAFRKKQQRESSIMSSAAESAGDNAAPITDNAAVDDRKMTLRAEFDVSDDYDFDTADCSDETEHRDASWWFDIYRRSDDDSLCVQLNVNCVPVVATQPNWQLACRYTIRLLPSRQLPPTEFVFLPFDNHFYGGDIKTISWPELMNPDNGFVTDGKIVIELDVESDPPYLTVDGKLWTPPVFPLSTLFADKTFMDMHVVCAGGEPIKVHKSVVCSASKVMRAMMLNEGTDVYRTQTFTITHPSATDANVGQFIAAMYAGWRADTMDEHAGALLELAHCYDAAVVANMAFVVLKQLLTDDSFWRTMRVAVALDHAPLVKVCAVFASEPTNEHLWQLLARDDGKAVAADDRCGGVCVLVKAMSAMREQEEGDEGMVEEDDQPVDDE